MPAHIRVYAHSQPIDPERGGVNFCGVMNDSDRRRVTLATLDDFVRHAGERKPLKPSDDALIALAPALIETLGASLPAGPWIVTSQDVWRFLSELLLEDEAFHCGTGGGSTAPTPPESAGPCEQRSVPSNAPQPSRHPRVVHMHHHPKPTEPRACQSDQAQQAAEPAAPPAPLLPALLAIHEAEKGEDALVALSAARQDRTVDAVAAEETFAKWLVAKARAAKTEETVTRIEGALRRASLGAKLNREIGETITKAKRALAGAPRE